MLLSPHVSELLEIHHCFIYYYIHIVFSFIYLLYTRISAECIIVLQVLNKQKFFEQLQIINELFHEFYLMLFGLVFFVL